MRALRAAKIRALLLGLFDDAFAFERVVFLDTDTVVCAPLATAVCAVDAPHHVAFVATPNRTHGEALLKQAFDVSDAVPEANTGVLAMRRSDEARRLLQVWREAYDRMSRKAAQLMVRSPARPPLVRG